jgi:trehalose synthase
MAALSHVPVGALNLERFESVLAPEDYERLLRVVQRGREMFDGRVVWSVNSTAQGGGVAEMLVLLLAYARGAGIDARWVVIAGNEDFFVLTKRIHNFLHGSSGDGGDLDDDARRVFDRVTELVWAGEASTRPESWTWRTRRSRSTSRGKLDAEWERCALCPGDARDEPPV